MVTSAKTNSCIATLNLVCAPIANSFVTRLVGNPRAEAIIRRSDFYMICGRPEVTFADIRPDSESGRVFFDLRADDSRVDSGWIEPGAISAISTASENAQIHIGIDDDNIRFYVEELGRDKTLVAAMSPDDVLLHRGRNDPVIGGLDSFIDVATFDLLYVGIARVGDSYDRLFANGHKARMEILANEPQRKQGARVSDETYLLLFHVEPLFMRIFGPESEIAGGDIDFSFDAKRLVSDAEKAFVHLLKPKYNSQLYPNYPKGKDGLYGAGLTGYTYAISEGIALLTKFGKMKGAREHQFALSNDADFILVKGDQVTFHIAGVDFVAA